MYRLADLITPTALAILGIGKVSSIPGKFSSTELIPGISQKGSQSVTWVVVPFAILLQPFNC